MVDMLAEQAKMVHTEAEVVDLGPALYLPHPLFFLLRRHRVLLGRRHGLLRVRNDLGGVPILRFARVGLSTRRFVVSGIRMVMLFVTRTWVRHGI